jgi:hypothetical protein
MGSSPNWSQGFVPSAAQWNAAFAGKQDQLAYTPLNKGGDTLTGPLITVASTALAAGFNVPPGTAPSSPNNGDIWNNGANFFAQVGSASIAFDMYDGATVQLGNPSITPAGSNGTGAFVMMGIGSGAKITPLYSSRAFISITGFAVNGTAGNQSLALYSGTGAIPANGSATIGSLVNGTMSVGIPANVNAAFAMSGIVTGLSIGVQYWFDLALKVASGTTFLTITSVTLLEL